MLSEITVDGNKYTAADDPLKLLAILRRHLDQTLGDSLTLSDAQLLSLKSWLLEHAESMSPGKALWLEESINGISYKVVAAIGKTEDGSIIVWHEPLPWPFGFKNESHKMD
jgi:hypothetical protein